MRRSREIVTPRLVGRPLAATDFDELCALHRDERIVAAFDAEVQTDEDTRAFLERKLAHWREHGFGIWMFHEPSGGFVGRCGIHRWRGEVELGYVVHSELWSQGYATEMARGVAAYAFDVLGLEDVVAFTFAKNARSRSVMDKVGFVYERDFVEDEVPHVLYRLTPEAARARSG